MFNDRIFCAFDIDKYLKKVYTVISKYRGGFIMKYCPKCNSQYPDDAAFCNRCGTPLAAGQTATASAQPSQTGAQQGQYQAQPQYQAQAYANPTDHTAEFDPKDISDNKVLAMATYLLGWFGIILALLGGGNSKYAAFHARQALKIEVISALLILCMAVLFLTVIVPIAGGICLIILFVVRVICFFYVCGGKAKEPPIISSFPFLK